MNWTEGRIKSFITSTIRSGFRRWPPKYEVLKEALIGKKVNPKTNRMANFYRCFECKNEYVGKEVQVDHIKPVVDPVKGFVDWNSFIERLFCSSENLQVLCISCHNKKTTKEKQIRNKK